MGKKNENKKVVRMKKKKPAGLGIILSLFALYLLILFVQSMTKEHVSIHEVTENQIADDETIRGVIIRDESLIRAETSGYINYYVGDSVKIGARTNIYSIDANGTISEKLSALDTGEITISEEDSNEIRNNIADFRNDFDISDYDTVQNFRYDLDNTLLEMSTVSLSERLNRIMDEEGGSTASFQVVKAKNAGIISLCSDGLEGLTKEQVPEDVFENMNDHWTRLHSTEKISSGDPVYRLVNSEYWSIVLPLTPKQYEKFKSEEEVKVTLKKDDIQMTVPVTTYTKGENQYARLDFDQYMIHYLNTRYVDVRIEFNHAKGLKIPNSAIFKKKCYVFPKFYLTEGSKEGGGGTGVFVQTYDKNGNPEKHFQTTEIYYIDSNDNVYIDTALFEANTIIIPVGAEASSAQRFELSITRELEGVYNCNQGYCRFQIIDKLYENEEYTIVRNNTTYGLATYDHIILNPDMIGENDIIY